jgi:hypothetical protein
LAVPVVSFPACPFNARKAKWRRVKTMATTFNAARQGSLVARVRNADLLLSQLRAYHEQTPKILRCIELLEEARAAALRTHT